MDKPNVTVPQVQELFKAGFHFGHTTAKWHPGMKKYIYTTKKGIHIIDLSKTHECLTELIDMLFDCSKKGSILIVGTKKQAAGVVKEVASQNGMFYVSNRWPGGLLTNFSTVRKCIKDALKLEEDIASGMLDRTKKEILEMKKELSRKKFLYEGVSLMTEKPECIIIIDGKIEKSALREATNLGIKTIGLVDTNTNPSKFDFVIPGNDDATKSVTLFLNFVAEIVKNSPTARDIQARRSVRADEIAKLTAKGDELKEEQRKQRELEAEKIRRIKEGTAPKITAVVTSESLKPSKTPKKAVTTTRVVKKVEKKAKGIDEVGLTKREVEILSSGGVKTIDDIKKRGKTGLLEITGIGPKTVDKILKKVENF
ncbi:30S ribosomal protein S2 [Candidatus Dojkabacteria bacterium]|nr:30S ribosomal protein S2 [Candidatus Dojkabacteria bacterium]